MIPAATTIASIAPPCSTIKAVFPVQPVWIPLYPAALCEKGERLPFPRCVVYPLHTTNLPASVAPSPSSHAMGDRNSCRCCLGARAKSTFPAILAINSVLPPECLKFPAGNSDEKFQIPSRTSQWVDQSFCTSQTYPPAWKWPRRA